MPVNIVLNKDPRFTSSCLGGTPPIVKYVLYKLNFSTTYQPQSDVQSETIIQTLEDTYAQGLGYKGEKELVQVITFCRVCLQ